MVWSRATVWGAFCTVYVVFDICVRSTWSFSPRVCSSMVASCRARTMTHQKEKNNGLANIHMCSIVSSLCVQLQVGASWFHQCMLLICTQSYMYMRTGGHILGMSTHASKHVWMCMFICSHVCFIVRPTCKHTHYIKIYISLCEFSEW